MTFSLMRSAPSSGIVLGAWLAATLAGAPQEPPGEPLSNAGVARAAARVDSVFVSRTSPATVVRGGDWGSYLLARLGVAPIPPDLRLRVVVNREHMVLSGRMGDLPYRTREALGAMLAMLPLQTPLAGEIEVARVARDSVRFRLATVRVNSVPMPETLLEAVTARLARQYGAPSPTGRDLFIVIPPDGNVDLVTGGVRLGRSPAGDGGR